MGKITVDTEKIDKLLNNIPKDNITELSDLIYAVIRRVRDIAGVHLRNQNRNTKSGWEKRLGQIKENYTKLTEKPKKDNSKTSDRNKPKILAKENRLKRYRYESSNTRKIERSNIMKENSANKSMEKA